MPASITRSSIAIVIACGALGATAMLSGAKPAPRKAGFGDVQSIFTTNCMPCHSAERHSAGLDLTSYQGVMAGGRMGAIVKPGDAANSVLVQAVTGTGTVDPMPPRGASISADAVKTIQDWINAGATADGGAAAPTAPPAPPYVGRQYLIQFDGDNGKESINFLGEKSLRVNHFTEDGAPETVANTRDEIRPNVFMVSWQEKDKSIITQVQDLEKNVTYQTVASNNKITHAVGQMKLVAP